MSKTGTISYEDFGKLLDIKAATGWTIEENDLRAAFSVFDKDNDGEISRDEVTLSLPVCADPQQFAVACLKLGCNLGKCANFGCAHWGIVCRKCYQYRP